MPIGVLKCVMAIWNALFIYTFICASCDGGAVDILFVQNIYNMLFIDFWSAIIVLISDIYIDTYLLVL